MMKDLSRKIEPIKLLIFDADGVLTNGHINVDHQGREFKMFHVHDGLGIVLWRKQGFLSAIISARACSAVQARAEDLKIDHIYLDAYPKKRVYEELLQRTGLSDNQVCFVGDDLADLPLLRRVGFSVGVANATAEVKTEVDYVTEKFGGAGAVRELIELLLKTKGLWEKSMEEFA
jgi:3-deoxy-D-manno-octulosonate 8-phosphate phosphatase (KDO 8-P phosphatase)